MKLRAALKVFLLSFLLLSLQLEARVHPLGHLGDRFQAGVAKAHVAAKVPSACATCDLLAGGCDVPASAQLAADFAGGSGAESCAPPASAAAVLFTAYLSRAPPVLS